MTKSKDLELLLPAMQINRNFPENYKTGELDFCKAEFAYDTNDVYQLSLSNVYLNAHGHLYNTSYQLVEESLINPATFKRLSFFKYLKKIRLRPKRKLPVKDQYLFCFDEWTNNHYHFICDFLPRLAVMEAQLPNYVLLLPDTPYIRKTGVELLNMFNLKPKRIEWIGGREVLKIGNLKLITHPLLAGRIHDELINRVKARLNINYNPAPATPYRMVYISRSKAAYRKVLNEAEVINVMKRFDFEIVHFEDLDIPGQMELASQTAILVSIHGAGLTNAVFMKPQTAVLEFRRDKVYHNQCFWHLSSAIGLKYYYLFGQPDSDQVIEGGYGCNLTIPINELQKTIEKMITDQTGS